MAKVRLVIRNYDQYKQAREDGVKKKALTGIEQGRLQAIAWEARYKAEKKAAK